MNKLLFLIIALISFFVNVKAQFSIPEPIINSGNYKITDTIYMSPTGNDSNSGSINDPVQSFSTAIQKLPWGVVGINGGNSYGLIMLQPGFYSTINGFQQTTSNWFNNGVFKNISIEGIGDVIIGGSKNNFATGNLIQLDGDHIFIKNIKLQYTSGIGLLFSRLTSRQNNILIDGVKVDSVGSFSMLFKTVDTILVRNSNSFYSSRPGHESDVSPCQWPSGIKFLDNSYCSIYSSEIAFSRGEGLNFQNSKYCNANNNKLHDNYLNLYNDNSSKLMIHKNFIYNTPNISLEYWRACPSNTDMVWASSGIMIANEGSCSTGSNPIFENCSTKCSFPTTYFENVDSMFIYNNIFQKTGTAISFWEGVTNTPNFNCIKNVFIFNNTIIGTMGMNGASLNGLLKFYFPSYNVLFNSNYARLDNIKVMNNIITYDTNTYSNMQPVLKNFNSFHPTQNAITFSNNLWIKNHNYLGTNDEVRTNMLTDIPLIINSIQSIVPCINAPYWLKTSNIPYSFLTTDYLGNNRNMQSNVGALEYNSQCTILDLKEEKKQSISIFPNPCNQCNSINFSSEIENSIIDYTIYTSTGIKMNIDRLKNANQINVTDLTPGIYYINFLLDGKSSFAKFIRL